MQGNVIANAFLKLLLSLCTEMWAVNRNWKLTMEEADMGYIRAEEILPGEIIELIQEYVDGTNIYIPRKQEHRGWPSPPGQGEWGAGIS